MIIRKFLAVVAAILFCLSLPVMAYAAPGGVYELAELGIRIAMPENTLVFSRNVAEDDPNLALIGMTKEQILDVMLDQDIYLNALEENGEYELVVSMTRNPIVSLSALDEDELNENMESLEQEYEKVGAQLLNCVVYDQADAKFLEIRFSMTEDNFTTYGLQYYTIYNNKAINVTLHSYIGEITANHETLMRNIVNSIEFTAGDPRAETNTESNGIGGTVMGTAATGAIGGIIAAVIIQARKKKQMKAQAEAASYEQPSSTGYDGRMDARLTDIGSHNTAQGTDSARRCPHCGGALAPGSAFCGKCGAKVE